MTPQEQPSSPHLSDSTTRSHALEQGPSLPPTVQLPSWLQAASGPAWPDGHVFLDDFQVEGVLGQGGMGVVYLVRQLSTSKRLAAKRTRLLDATGRRRFLAELQTWIDLPDHPHLAFCRFFRTVDDEVVIFTDYAEGGSLADRIRNGRVGGLASALDVAIQVAWGLHALHERGLVHQDVKPANVLLTAAGLAQVADFGLARARSRACLPEDVDATPTCLVSGGAMTPAYCSPEQALGQPVSRRTDIWSWGVLVLEMFAGEVPCCIEGGPRAPEVLERLTATDQMRLPVALIDVLRRCFRTESEQRWASLAAVADLLAQIYRDEIGRDYPRSRPAGGEPGRTLPTLHEGQTALGIRWQQPRPWLCRALEACGRDPAEVDSVLPPLATSRKGQAVADLAVYEEARALLEQLVASGQFELQPDLASLCVQKSLVHSALNDLPGALALADRAVGLWQELVEKRGRRELTSNLARSYLQKVRTLRAMGDNREAATLCDRIARLYHRMDNRRRRRELREDLAAAYVNKGLALRALGDVRSAVSLYDQAISLWQQIVHDEKQSESAIDLAWAYLTKASALSAMSKGREAVELCEKAIAIRRRLVQHDGRAEFRADLARAYLHKANAMRAQQNARMALPVYDQAIEILARLVEGEGRDDLAHDLARVLLARAHALRQLKEHREAARLCAQAVAILERLSYREGRLELAPELARAYMHQGNALRSAGDASEAYRLSDLSVQAWQRLVQEDGREEFRGELARALVSKAQALRQLGSHRKSLPLFDQAHKLRQDLLAEGYGNDVTAELARDRVLRAEVLLTLGDPDRAKDDLNEAARVLQRLVEQERRTELRPSLHRAWQLLRQLESS